jgi:ATP-binding cassette subfamily G (WHITE) protein 2 (SNQ2)
MLEVIGAGATATTSQDWYRVWKKSKEANIVDEEINNIHQEGRKHQPVEVMFTSHFAAPWLYQTWELVKRNHVTYWRDPTYLMAKLTVNIICGLFLGFTFFNASNSQQDTLNKIFVSLI